MAKLFDKDQRLISSVEFYYREGDVGEFLKEAWVWAWRLAMGRYGLDEDACAEVVLRLVLRAEEILKMYREREYSNFPAFFTSYAKKIIFNQRRREIRFDRSEILADRFERFYDPNSDFTKEILNQHRENTYQIHDILSELEPLHSLIVKLKHRIPLELSELRILYLKLKEKNKSLRDYYLEDLEEERKIWKKQKILNDKLSRMYQNVWMDNFKKVEKWKVYRKNLRETSLSVSEEKSFRTISSYLGMSQYTVRRIYYSAITKLKQKAEIRVIGRLEAA
ncbi:sigma-70 family RNA polymerase sigma factor [Leptospira sarikeiensis]|uniref:sigma-70 family RNA polymerase sigma factor n=1 Tax=Leptospira sarikeiensis TaxID=2484943 RepID=UPI001FE9BB6F|nr:sigma-70 family RNA polymerase sigma factor [Leptospira sarikeiensis]